MAKLYIAEYAAVGIYRGAGINVAAETPIAEQTVAVGAGSLQSTAFNTNTRFVRISNDSTSACSVLFGTNPTAANTNMRLAANQTEYFQVPDLLAAPLKVAVIQNLL